MKDEVRFFFRSIPPMEELLRLSWVEPFEHELGRDAVKSLFNAVLDDIRNEARNGKIRLDLSAAGWARTGTSTPKTGEVTVVPNRGR